MEEQLSTEQQEMLKYLEDMQANNPAEYEMLVSEMGAQQRARSGQAESLTIVPTPGFVAKTRSLTNKGRKVFVNLCTSEHIDPCSAMGPEDASPEGAPPQSADETRIRIPLSLGQPREDLDKSSEACTVYDVVFHPETLDTSKNDRAFRDFMMNVVLAQVEQKYGEELSSDFTFPKMLNGYKGVAPLPQFVRAKPKVAASEGGGFTPEQQPQPPTLPAGPLIEEVDDSGLPDVSALLPAPAYVLRPCAADGSPLDVDALAAEEGGGVSLRAPARLELKVHLPALAGLSGRGGPRRSAPANATERLSVSVSAWDVRVRVADLYSLALELPHAVHATVEDACLELERCVLTVWLRVLDGAEAADATEESAVAVAASKEQATVWEAQLAKEARARKAKKLLEQRRKDEAADAAAKRDADAGAARDEAARAYGAAGVASQPAAARAEVAAPPAVKPIELSNTLMYELE
ncbi:pre-RNA processing PIH1/Nop17-domain-containing protein [Pavlovales sp. CCMP2436]|nr:pre-RNA processing PIH1/Nop17-domain-containing protein [Pavlovales sp. CCMP2436]